LQIKDWIAKHPQLTQRQRRLAQAGLVGLAVAAAICLAQWAGLFTSMRLTMVDYLYETSGDPGDDILIVAIDEASQQALGDWPWAFDPYVRLFERLEGARAAGFDVLLPNPGPEGNPETSALLEATRQAGNVILPLATLQLNQHAPGELYSADLPIRPFSTLLEAGAGAGAVAVYPDRDGTLRRVPLLVDGGGGETWEAFSLQVLRLYLDLGDAPAFLYGDRVLIGDETGITYAVRTDDNAAMFVNFVGRPNTFPTYSFIDVIEDRVASDVFENRIVLIGMINTLAEMDLHQTPVSTGRMAGIEFQANAIHTLLYHRPLVQASEVETALTVVVLALFSALVLSQLEAVPGAIFTLLLAVGYFIFTSIRFDGGHLPDVLFPYLTIFVNYAALSATRFASEQVGRRRVSDIFGRFVSADVRDMIVDMALEDPELIQPGGRQMDISVLFADIRGFTTLSENLPPSDVVEILNQYLESMGEQVFAHGGTLDKYTGDGMMVLFGAPLEQPDHAERAVRAALAMQRAAAEVSHERGDVEWDMVYGIGITTGPAVVGHIGSKRRLDYTAIGDTVNLAARLEGKAPPGAIFISQTTYDAVRHMAVVEALEPMMVKGKAKPVVVYKVLGLRDEAE
jgi:adenylate cyclase